MRAEFYFKIEMPVVPSVAQSTGVKDRGSIQLNPLKTVVLKYTGNSHKWNHMHYRNRDLFDTAVKLFIDFLVHSCLCHTLEKTLLLFYIFDIKHPEFYQISSCPSLQHTLQSSWCLQIQYAWHNIFFREYTFGCGENMVKLT